MTTFNSTQKLDMPIFPAAKILPIFIIAISALATGCSESRAPEPKAATSLPSGTISTETPPSMVGTIPAGPTADVVGTTSAAKSDISKTQQSAAMPLPGQANDHSTLSPAASQKADTNKK